MPSSPIRPASLLLACSHEFLGRFSTVVTCVGHLDMELFNAGREN